MLNPHDDGVTPPVGEQPIVVNPPSSSSQNMASKDFTVTSYMPEATGFWFHMLESDFVAHGITDDPTKVRLTLKALPPDLRLSVMDIVMTEDSNRYTKVKNTITSSSTLPESARIRQILEGERRGTRTMSQFLAHLRNLLGGGTTAHHDSPFLKELIMREIPTNIKYALLVSGKTSLNDIVADTDKILSEFPESNTPVCSIATQEPKPSSLPQHSNNTHSINALTTRMSEMDFRNKTLTQEKDHLNKRIDHLERLVNNLENKLLSEQQSLLARMQKLEQRPTHSYNGNRGRSPSHNRDPSADNRTRCSFHRRFGTNARRCTIPCDMSHQLNQEGN